MSTIITSENEILCSSFRLRAPKEEEKEEQSHNIIIDTIMCDHTNDNNDKLVNMMEHKPINNNYYNNNIITEEEEEYNANNYNDDNCSYATPSLSDEESSLSSTSSFNKCNIVNDNNDEMLLVSPLKKKNNDVHKTILLNNNDTIRTRNNNDKINYNTITTTRSERRVRGLWNINDNNNNESLSKDLFSKIHNNILIDNIFNYLSIYDKIIMQKICKRFKYCVNQPNCWKDVIIQQEQDNATDDAQNNASNNDLLDCITTKASHIEKILINNQINNLTSNFATLGIGSCINLQILKIKSYDNLYDNHINLILLIKKYNLIDISIEYCRNITNVSLRYIMKHIDKLSSLSVRGCFNITDDGLSYLTSKLEEISTVFPSLSSSSSSQKKLLNSLDLSYCENITASGICNKLLSSSSNQKYKIQKLLLRGSGNTWNNNLFNMLQKKLSWYVLKELDISTTDKEENQEQNKHHGYLTDEAFNNLSKSATLTYMNISGHEHVTGLSIASILNSNPNLQMLDISNCTSIIQNLNAFSNVLCTSAHKNLHTLLLKNCFGKERCNDSTSSYYYSLVLYFIQSICKSTLFRYVVKEINFEGNYLIDKYMVEMLRACCNNNIILKLKGTKYYEEKDEEY